MNNEIEGLIKLPEHLNYINLNDNKQFNFDQASLDKMSRLATFNFNNTGRKDIKFLKNYQLQYVDARNNPGLTITISYGI
jgi:hypothetical protein